MRVGPSFDFAFEVPYLAEAHPQTMLARGAAADSVMAVEDERARAIEVSELVL
jgi:hypothetical protein